jgi:Uma2 family endonuclease
MTAIVLNLEPLTQKLTHEQFYELCIVNKDIAMERSPEGELIIVPPVGGESGKKEARYILKLGIWNEQTGLGEVFSSWGN